MQIDPDIILYADEAERQLLGCLLMYPETWASVAGEVRPSDFYSQVHRRIFEQVTIFQARGAVPNAVTIAPLFEADEDLIALGGSRCYFADLCGNIVSRMAAKDYAVHIRDIAARRSFVALMRESELQALELTEALPTVIANTVAEAAKIDNGEVGSTNQADVFADVIREITNPRKCDSTGIEALDRSMQGGLYRGWTYGFAAHEKVGKTTLAHSISYNLNMAGVRHTYIALEMGKEQISQRQLARRAGINSLAFLQGNTDVRFQERMRAAADSMPHNVQYMNLYQADFSTLKARLAREVLKENIGGFIVDYLQLVGGAAKGQNEESHQRDVAQWIASFCRQHGVWSIVISQLNKDNNTFGGSGLTKSCDQLYKLFRCTANGCENHAWLELAVTRYTPNADVGSDMSPSLILRKDVGPYFTDFYDQSTGEYS